MWFDEISLTVVYQATPQLPSHLHPGYKYVTPRCDTKLCSNEQFRQKSFMSITKNVPSLAGLST